MGKTEEEELGGGAKTRSSCGISITLGESG